MNKPEISYQPITLSSGWANGPLVPQGLTLHSTAWPGKNAQGIRDYFNAPGRGASIHAAVDDKQIIQCMPWTKKAGHVGSGSKGSYNTSRIGVEMCEPSGLTYNKCGSVITSYNPPVGYFKAVWDNAVALFAWLCQEYKLDPLKDGVILSHAETHARGYGDNHGDTAHWFKWESVTMDDFRQAVAKKMKGEDEIVTYEQWKEYMNRYMSEPEGGGPSSWAAESCQKAIDKGILQGDGKGNYSFQKPLTREGYLVMQDRQGQI